MILAFFVLTVVIGGLSYVSRLERFRITEIKVVGNEALSADKITEAVNQRILANYFFLFPKNNFLIYPKREIRKDLLVDFMRIREAKVYREGRNTLVVEVKERKANYLACALRDESEVPSENTHCYFIDDKAYVFSEAPQFSGSVYFKFFRILREGEQFLGENFFSEEEFNRLIQFKDSVAKINLLPTSLFIGADGHNDLFVQSGKSDVPAKIIFNSGADYLKLFDNLSSALVTEPFLSAFKNKAKDLLYIDLRYENKVYYKFRQ